MERVHSVSVDIAGQIRRTADAADDASLMRLQLQLEQRGLERGEHGEIAAAGTPIRMDPAAVSLFRELAGFGGGRRCSWRAHINQRSEVRGHASTSCSGTDSF